jgi:hypothetical protein
MTDPNLNEKLERLHAQGELSNEELAQLKGALPGSTPTPERTPHSSPPEPTPHPDTKKVFWLRVMLACVLVSGAVKSCQLMKKDEERNNLLQQVQPQQERDGPRFGIQQNPNFQPFGFGVAQKPQPPAPRGVTVDELERALLFNRINVGMTLKEVEAILGPAAETKTEDARQPDGSTSRQVTFATWMWRKRNVLPAGLDGQPKQQGVPWIRVYVKDGRVASKELLK